MEKVGSYGESWEELLGGLRRLRQWLIVPVEKAESSKVNPLTSKLAVPLP